MASVSVVDLRIRFARRTRSGGRLYVFFTVARRVIRTIWQIVRMRSKVVAAEPMVRFHDERWLSRGLFAGAVFGAQAGFGDAAGEGGGGATGGARG